MIEHPFTLVPFEAPDISTISLTGTLSVESHLLTAHYLLAGETKTVLLPSPSLAPSRKDELWKATCFEFFLAIKNQPGYWEFNMSPSGDWNVYRMDAYRRIGFREETTISKLPFEFKKESSGYSLDVSVDLTSLIQDAAEIQIGLTAVIQLKDGRETYWALAHPAPYADFHLRESFILAPVGQTHLLGQSALDD